MALTTYDLQRILTMSTVIKGEFEWEDAKEASNISKHGIAFEEAASVFADRYAVVLDDGAGVGRCWAIGFSFHARMLTVVHVESAAHRARILSARRASSFERRLYTAW
jgi:uncharacterized DUF497 family protein